MPPSGQFLKLLQSVRRSEEDAILIALQGRYMLCYLQRGQILPKNFINRWKYRECLFPSEPSFAHGFAFGACIGMGICIIAYKTKGF